MKVVVCAKQVPDTNEVKIDPVKGTLIREGVPSILNPDDTHAIEAALALKDRDKDIEVDVITMGPPQAKEMLRECLAMGVDNAYLLSDRAFGGADTCATSTTIASGIKKIGDAKIIFAGRQAIDGDTAQVGPQIARRLGIPSVTYVQKIREINEDYVVVERQLEDGYEVLKVKLPCLLTVVEKLNTPRYMSIKGIMEAYEKQIISWNHSDIGLEASECGLDASPTQVARSFTPPVKGKGRMLSGTIEGVSKELISELKDKNIL